MVGHSPSTDANAFLSFVSPLYLRAVEVISSNQHLPSLIVTVTIIALHTNIPPRCSHAKPCRSCLFRPPSSHDYFLYLHSWSGLHVGLVARRLRAVLTVLYTATSLNRYQCALLHLGRIEVLSMDSGCTID